MMVHKWRNTGKKLWRRRLQPQSTNLQCAKLHPGIRVVWCVWCVVVILSFAVGCGPFGYMSSPECRASVCSALQSKAAVALAPVRYGREQRYLTAGLRRAAARSGHCGTTGRAGVHPCAGFVACRQDPAVAMSRVGVCPFAPATSQFGGEAPGRLPAMSLAFPGKPLWADRGKPFFVIRGKGGGG